LKKGGRRVPQVLLRDLFHGDATAELRLVGDPHLRVLALADSDAIGLVILERANNLHWTSSDGRAATPTRTASRISSVSSSNATPRNSSASRAFFPSFVPSALAIVFSAPCTTSSRSVPAISSNTPSRRIRLRTPSLLPPRAVDSGSRTPIRVTPLALMMST